MNLSQAIGAVILGASVLLIVILFIVLRERLRREEERQRMADAAFEAEALALARSAGVLESPDSRVLGWQEPAVEVGASEEGGLFGETEAGPQIEPASLFAETEPIRPVTSMAASIAPPLSSAANAPSNFAPDVEVPFIRQPADVTCAPVLRQLQNAGMIEQQEGYVELHGNPRAAITLRLKGGRHCLVVPYHESEVFTQRNLKRFQLLIYVGRDGKGTALSSVEELIAAKVGGAFGM